MDVAADGERVAASLADWLTRLTFVDLTTDEVTAQLIDAAATWAGGQGWRVYRRAPSVVPLPPPMDRQHSVLDVACARPDGPPVVIEVDHTDRRRTLEKLIAESEAGRIAVWLRWGTGRFVAPPTPVRMVTFEVTARRGMPGQGRRYARLPATELPPPAHSLDGTGTASAVTLPLPSVEAAGPVDTSTPRGGEPSQ
ncbi:MAG TPA: hypothetical protein VF657_15615 [Actinoplanes sp.]|jgi:hypothetical protein